MSASKLVTRETLKLGDPKVNWFQWIEIQKRTALAADIWQYCNPDTPSTDIPEMSIPIEPRPDDYNPFTSSEQRAGKDRRTVGELSEDEKDFYKRDLIKFDRDLKKAENRRSAVLGMMAFISQSLHQNYLHYTYGCDTPHDFLVKLKDRFCPSTRLDNTNWPTSTTSIMSWEEIKIETRPQEGKTGARQNKVK